MGKAKRARRRETALATPVAVRHEFGAGLLGHDLSASQWIVNVSERTLLGVDVAFACVRLMGDIIAGSEVGEWDGEQRLQPSPLTRWQRPPGQAVWLVVTHAAPAFEPPWQRPPSSHSSLPSTTPLPHRTVVRWLQIDEPGEKISWLAPTMSETLQVSSRLVSQISCAGAEPKIAELIATRSLTVICPFR